MVQMLIRKLICFISLISKQTGGYHHAHSCLTLHEIHNKCLQVSQPTQVLFNNVLGTNVLCNVGKWHVPLHLCGGLQIQSWRFLLQSLEVLYKVKEKSAICDLVSANKPYVRFSLNSL